MISDIAEEMIVKINSISYCSGASPVAQLVKNMPAMWETWV